MKRKIIIGTYILSIIIILILLLGIMLGSNVVMDTEAMLPYTLSERCVLYLAIWTVIEIAICILMYLIIKENVINKCVRMLVFLPVMICSCSIVYILVVIVSGMYNSFIVHG